MTTFSFESSGRAPRANGLGHTERSSQDDTDTVHDDQGENFSFHKSYCTDDTVRSLENATSNRHSKPVNLLAKAVALLSRREYSEQELRRKLAKYTEDNSQIDAVIARLQKENWQSDDRFAENFVLFRQERWGNQKILQALRQHNLPIETVATLKESLRETELDRASEVWQRKFQGQYPSTPQEKAKQMRFLASRGFSADVVYKVISRARDA